jgi:hypothetical protein
VIWLFLLLFADPPVPPKQPVPYSHKQHLAMGLQCKNCHTSPDPGEAMGIPQVKALHGMPYIGEEGLTAHSEAGQACRG